MVKVRARLDSLLPQTPCTQEMRERVEAYARVMDCSIAEVQRAAIETFFLSAPVTTGVTNDTESAK